MRLFALYAAVILCVCGLSATLAAERFGQWSLEQPDDFVFALSFKRPILFDDRTAASQLAFVCNQEKKRRCSLAYTATAENGAQKGPGGARELRTLVTLWSDRHRTETKETGSDCRQ